MLNSKTDLIYLFCLYFTCKTSATFFSLCLQRNTILKNVQFVGDKVIGHIITLYLGKELSAPKQVLDLQSTYKQIK